MLSFIFCLLHSGAILHAEPTADSNLVAVGNTKLKIPAPEGFVRCDGVSEILDSALEGLVPRGNRYLAYFAPPEIYAKLKAGESPDIPQNFNVQTLRSAENRDIGPASFKEIVAQFRNEIDGMEPTDWDKMVSESAIGGEFSLELVGQPKIFSDTESGLGFTTLLAAEIDGVKKQGVASCVMTLANGKLLYMYSTAPFGSLEETLANEKSVLKWAEAVQAVNPVFIPEYRGQNWAIIAAVVAVAVTVILLRRSKNRGA